MRMPAAFYWFLAGAATMGAAYETFTGRPLLAALNAITACYSVYYTTRISRSGKGN